MDYEFTVRNGDQWGSGSGYTVYLPHSCDGWVITEQEDKEIAISEMIDFILQASEALIKLRNL